LLLAGNVTDFGFEDPANGPKIDFDLTFDVTGGLLQPFYANNSGGTLITAENSGFTGDWTIDHSGTKVKNDTAPVPIATSFLLFGSGAIGLVGFWRKFGK
jgi:hypothetical protein